MRRFILWAGILTASTVANPAQEPAQAQAKYKGDPRLARLTEFFQQYGSPAEHLSADFLAAADMNSLDWRLLPSISIVETCGGKTSVRNNMFGWNSARTGFPSARDGVYAVAARLANSDLYKGKDLDQLLKRYNPRRIYPRRIKALMRQLDADEPLAARQAPSPVFNPSAELQNTARLELVQ